MMTMTMTWKINSTNSIYHYQLLQCYDNNNGYVDNNQTNIVIIILLLLLIIKIINII